MEKKNINLNCNSNDTPECTISDRGVGFNISQPCNGTTRVYFENFSCITGEFQVQIFNNTPPPCIMTAIIEFQNGEIVAYIISQNSYFNLFSSNLRRIFIRCDGNPAGTCTGFGSVNHTFCFCCSDNNNCCNPNCDS